MLRRADKVIATSQPYANASLALAEVHEKVVVVPLGVPPPIQGNPDEADAARLSGIRAALRGRRYIMAVGRLVPYKGFDTLIEAATRLPSDVVILVVGTGPLLDGLKASVAAKGLGDRVQFLGGVASKVLNALYADAAIVCMTSVSRAEAFGVVLIEGMAHGRPIVATEIVGSGVPWVNDHGVTGFNVPPRDAEALADACQAILSDVVIAQSFSNNASDRYRRLFSEEASVAATMAVYADLLHKARDENPDLLD